MPKLPVTPEPTYRKENGTTFSYAAETSTRPFAYNAQEWKEYRLTMNVEDATTTLSDCAEYATGKNTTFT